MPHPFQPRVLGGAPKQVRFYAGGEILALLLEKDGAISSWRELLGPGDPSVGRKTAPDSLRARWGSNKQANAAHGADSEDAARREIEHIFGEGAWVVGALGAECEGGERCS